eukprot:361242-Chlamydomonas_euryale.AAC.1
MAPSMSRGQVDDQSGWPAPVGRRDATVELACTASNTRGSCRRGGGSARDGRGAPAHVAQVHRGRACCVDFGRIRRELRPVAVRHRGRAKQRPLWDGRPRTLWDGRPRTVWDGRPRTVWDGRPRTLWDGRPRTLAAAAAVLCRTRAVAKRQMREKRRHRIFVAAAAAAAILGSVGVVAGVVGSSNQRAAVVAGVVSSSNQQILNAVVKFALQGIPAGRQPAGEVGGRAGRLDVDHVGIVAALCCLCDRPGFRRRAGSPARRTSVLGKRLSGGERPWRGPCAAAARAAGRVKARLMPPMQQAPQQRRAQRVRGAQRHVCCRGYKVLHAGVGSAAAPIAAGRAPQGGADQRSRGGGRRAHESLVVRLRNSQRLQHVCQRMRFGQTNAAGVI